MHKLSPKMTTALICTKPGDLMKPGPTRAALMRRGLVFNRTDWPRPFGHLSPAGERLRLTLVIKEVR